MSDALDERAIWLGRVILPHEPALRTWLESRRVVHLDPDDIIQETYTRLIALQSVKEIRSPRSYLFQTAKSVMFTHLRRAKIVPMTSVADLDVLGLEAGEPTPEDYAIDRDELQRLAKAIAELPERSRSVFRLRRVEELSQREIATALGMTEGTVERLMGEALFRLRALLGRQRNGASRASQLHNLTSPGTHAARDRKRD